MRLNAHYGSCMPIAVILFDLLMKYNKIPDDINDWIVKCFDSGGIEVGNIREQVERILPYYYLRFCNEWDKEQRVPNHKEVYKPLALSDNEERKSIKFENIHLFLGDDLKSLLEPNGGLIISRLVDFSNEFYEMAGMEMPANIHVDIQEDIAGNEVKIGINGKVIHEFILSSNNDVEKCEIIIRNMRNKLITALI